MRADRVGNDTLLAQHRADGGGRAADARADSAPRRFRRRVLRPGGRRRRRFCRSCAWILFGPEPRVPNALVAAVAVLIIACPCALGLATPMAIMVGHRSRREGRRARARCRRARTARARRHARRRQDGNAHRRASGRHGRGRRAGLVGIRRAPARGGGGAGERAPAREGHSRRGAIGRRRACRRCRTSNRRPASASAASSRAGMSCSAARAFMTARGVDVSWLASRNAERRQQGQTVLAVAVDGRVAGAIAIADTRARLRCRRDDSIEARGVRVVMLTGDNRATAEAIARSVGDRRSPRGGAAGRQARRRGRIAASGPPRRDGRRRHQRRAGPGTGRRRHRDGHAEPTSPWRARASRSSKVTFAASCAPVACRWRR